APVVRRRVTRPLSRVGCGHDDCSGATATAAYHGKTEVGVQAMKGRSTGETRHARDPRDYQVFALSTLLVLGELAFGFDVSWLQVGITLTSALAWQWLAASMGWPSTLATSTSPPFEWKSALISGLSLCLLLRTRILLWAAVAGVVAVGSKYVLRVPRAGGGGTKHLLNP